MFKMKFKTINPATEEVISEYGTMPNKEVLNTAKNSHAAFYEWKQLDISERAIYFKKLASVLRKNKDSYAKLMTTEMGKPIKQSLSEVEKCAWTAEIYADKSAEWLEEEAVQADGKKHMVVFEPLGVILSIMPWNFPFWQAFRFGIPTLMAGNVTILKHSNIVPQCALAIEDAFNEAGFPEFAFKSIITNHLMGISPRVTKLMAEGLKLIFCFDGRAPDLKIYERERREHRKRELYLMAPLRQFCIQPVKIQFLLLNHSVVLRQPQTKFQKLNQQPYLQGCLKFLCFIQLLIVSLEICP